MNNRNLLYLLLKSSLIVFVSALLPVSLMGQFFGVSYDFDALIDPLEASTVVGLVDALPATNSDGDTLTSSFGLSSGYFVDDYDSGDFIEFTINAQNPANNIQLTNVSFSQMRYAVNQGATNYTVRSNIDGFVSIIGSGLVTENPSSVALNGLNLVTPGDSLIVRIYGTGISGLGANTNFNGFGVDNISIAGNVVPEPSQYGLLLSLTAVGFLMLRRRASVGQISVLRK